jgi:hypothetical protein
MSQSSETIRGAAFGGVIGAGMGAALVAAVVGVCGGVSGVTSSGPEVLPWVATIILVIVSQFAAAGAICTLAILKFVEPETRPAARPVVPGVSARRAI